MMSSASCTRRPSRLSTSAPRNGLGIQLGCPPMKIPSTSTSSAPTTRTPHRGGGERRDNTLMRVAGTARPPARRDGARSDPQEPSQREPRAGSRDQHARTDQNREQGGE